MKRFLAITFLLAQLFISCDETKSKKNSVSRKPIIIQIQLFSDMKNEEVELIAKEIKEIYPHLEILEPIDFPENAYYQPRNRYRADSIIKFLSSETENGFVKLGLTSKDISVTKGKNPDFGVIGLGYRPEKSCVSSTFRLNKNNKNSQFYKVAIHEIVHTQGLPHCPVKTCFMCDADGKNHTNDLKDFCKKCKTHLQRKNWKLS
jgi:archaemetzincin